MQMRAIHEKEMADIVCQTTTKKDTKNGRSESLYALIALALCVYELVSRQFASSERKFVFRVEVI